jgi:hypothetical protein
MLIQNQTIWPFLQASLGGWWVPDYVSWGGLVVSFGYGHGLSQVMIY